MYCMFGTLDVLKLSGWLNARVFCRVQRGAWEAGGMQSAGGRRPVDGSGKHVGAIQLEVWAGAERTRNMYCMLVTLEVSKLSGWLKARALCRGPKGGRLRGQQAGQETGGRGRDGLSDARRGPDW